MSSTALRPQGELRGSDGRVGVSSPQCGPVRSGVTSSFFSRRRESSHHRRRFLGVGPGAPADPAAARSSTGAAGINAHVEAEELGFGFDRFELAWEVLAGVTTAQLAPERRQEAKEAVQAVMWPHGNGARHFRNVTQFLVGRLSV